LARRVQPSFIAPAGRPGIEAQKRWPLAVDPPPSGLGFHKKCQSAGINWPTIAAMIHETRIHFLNEAPVASNGEYVLYWMQASQRTRCNHALEYAIERANELGLPVVACFGLMDDYPEANERSYAFLIEGLRDVSAGLRERGILFAVKHGPAPAAALHFGKRASQIVCDWNYLRHHKAWRHQVADEAGKAVVALESEVVVPVEVASDHHEYAAKTIRPKIHKHLKEYLRDVPPQIVKHKSLKLDVRGDIDVTDVDSALAKLKIDRSVARSPRFTGGEVEAHRLLQRFIRLDLKAYDTDRNEPAEQHTSLMSLYLHFGQISPIEIALAVMKAGDADRYLEELIVRRELSMNFCNFEPRYDDYECLPVWAKKSLSEHRSDKREYIYSRAQLEAAKTHDPYWNAAQTEMTATGFMHNYMRMYWGKKILEWSKSPQAAYETTLHLNNKYLLDGRDANSFANVAWIYGLHDRPWGPKRKIFGLVRYMNAAGLERKFEIGKYVERVGLMARDGTTDD
jgi:deoxyribodipyrimidine photo-lyase